MTGNELALASSTDIANMTSDQFAEMMGYTRDRRDMPFPRMTINSQAEDDEGRPLRPGTFVIPHEVHGRVYSKKPKTTTTIHFRPMVIQYQYNVYDSELKQYTSRSIFFKDWREDILDTSGGRRCGKVTGKAKDNLNEYEKEQQKKIKCQRYMFGLLAMDGVTASGEDVVIEDMPVLFRHGGLNFMSIGEVLSDIQKNGQLPWSHYLELGTKREIHGANTFYTCTVEKVPGAEMGSLTKDEMLIAAHFMDYVSAENDEVVRLHNKAYRDDPEVIEVHATVVEDDLNDDIPL